MIDHAKKFIEHGALAVDFRDVLDRAENGDKLAARSALETIVFLLSERNAHPVTGKRWPVPDYVRDYLADALKSMQDGDTGDQAFHLKGGPRQWRHFEKRLAADQVFQCVRNGLSIEEAAATAEEIIKRQLKDRHDAPAWQRFANRTVSQETLKTWYYELKDELEAIHERGEDL